MKTSLPPKTPVRSPIRMTAFSVEDYLLRINEAKTYDFEKIVNISPIESRFFPFRVDVACNCGCGQSIIVPELYNRLLHARLELNCPMLISSWNRCPEFNASEGGSATSAHLYGEAADILVTTSGYRFRLVNALINAGFKRILIYPWGVHVDVSWNKPSPLLTVMSHKLPTF